MPQAWLSPSSALKMGSAPSSHHFLGENTTSNQDGQSWNQTSKPTASSAANGALRTSAQAAKATTSIQGALDRGALKAGMKRQ